MFTQKKFRNEIPEKYRFEQAIMIWRKRYRLICI